MRARNRRKSPVGSGRSSERIALMRLPPWRAIARALAVASAASATLLTLFWALDQPIRTVSVTGRFQHVSPVAIERIVALQARGAGLLTVDLAAVARAIGALPWVDTVSVERDWPHGLAVRVTEQTVAARWGSDGLVNMRGELFATGVRHVPAGLASLSGPDGAEAQVTQRYLAMQSRLSQEHLAITSMRLDARGAWRLALDDGITIRLGRTQVDRRFGKFMSAALAIVRRRASAISYVDMRYTNGFAIGWRGGRGALKGRAPVPDARAGGTHAMDGHGHGAHGNQHA
jgi:cell division protein FtsQ